MEGKAEYNAGIELLPCINPDIGKVGRGQVKSFLGAENVRTGMDTADWCGGGRNSEVRATGEESRGAGGCGHGGFGGVVSGSVSRGKIWLVPAGRGRRNYYVCRGGDCGAGDFSFSERNYGRVWGARELRSVRKSSLWKAATPKNVATPREPPDEPKC